MNTAWNLAGYVPNVSEQMKTLGITLSKAGSITSLICAIHCMVTPLALLALPVIAAHSSGGLDVFLGAFFAKTTEWVLLGIIGFLAGFGLLATYPVHRDARPAYLSGFGLFLLIVSHLWVVPESASEIVLDVLGASLIAWAGFWNRRLCQCLDCHTEDKKAELSHSSIPPVADLSPGQ